MFVDSDVELTAGCVTQMRAEMRDLGWVGIQAMIMGKESLSYWQKAENANFSLFVNHAGPKGQIATNATLFRRSTLLAIPFDPNLMESSEDIDLSWRLVKLGLRIGVSHAVAYHLHRRDFLAFVAQRFRNGKGSVRLASKYGSAWILIHPLQRTLVLSIRGILNGKATLVPFWVVWGCAEFAGVVSASKASNRK
jgi:GT2 family glycosyltransferase